MFSPKFAQKLSPQTIGRKSHKPQVGRILLKFLTLLATDINITKCFKFTIITKTLNLDILKLYFKQKSQFFRPFLVNLKITLKQELTVFIRFNCEALISALFYFKKVSHLVIYYKILYYMHFLDFNLAFLLLYSCDFSPMLCSIFQSNPINYEVWKNFSTSKVSGFNLSVDGA